MPARPIPHHQFSISTSAAPPIPSTTATRYGNQIGVVSSWGNTFQTSQTVKITQRYATDASYTQGLGTPIGAVLSL